MKDLAGWHLYLAATDLPGQYGRERRAAGSETRPSISSSIGNSKFAGSGVPKAGPGMVDCSSMKRLIPILGFCLTGWASLAPAVTNTTINSTNKWAWSASAGWINCRPDTTNGAAIGEFVCSGYFYSSVAGWIDLGDGSPSNNYQYTQSTNDYGVNHDGAGHLTGYAWAPSSGWISFEWTNSTATNAPKVNLQSGVLTGYAWSESLGYISLTNISAFCQTVRFAAPVDSNSNGLADAWEIETAGALGTLSPSADSDGDGLTDYEEYIADSDPLNSGSSFVFSAMSNATTNITLSWSCSDERLYKVETRANLTNTAGWIDAGLIISTNDGTATVTLPASLSTQTFYRVRAIVPLSN